MKARNPTFPVKGEVWIGYARRFSALPTGNSEDSSSAGHFLLSLRVGGISLYGECSGKDNPLISGFLGQVVRGPHLPVTFWKTEGGCLVFRVFDVGFLDERFKLFSDRLRVFDGFSEKNKTWLGVLSKVLQELTAINPQKYAKILAGCYLSIGSYEDAERILVENKGSIYEKLSVYESWGHEQEDQRPRLLEKLFALVADWNDGPTYEYWWHEQGDQHPRQLVKLLPDLVAAWTDGRTLDLSELESSDLSLATWVRLCKENQGWPFHVSSKAFQLYKDWQGQQLVTPEAAERFLRSLRVGGISLGGEGYGEVSFMNGTFLGQVDREPHLPVTFWKIQEGRFVFRVFNMCVLNNYFKLLPGRFRAFDGLSEKDKTWLGVLSKVLQELTAINPQKYAGILAGCYLSIGSYEDAERILVENNGNIYEKLSVYERWGHEREDQRPRLLEKLLALVADWNDGRTLDVLELESSDFPLSTWAFLLKKNQGWPFHVSSKAFQVYKDWQGPQLVTPDALVHILRLSDYVASYLVAAMDTAVLQQDGMRAVVREMLDDVSRVKDLPKTAATLMQTLYPKWEDVPVLPGNDPESALQDSGLFAFWGRLYASYNKEQFFKALVEQKKECDAYKVRLFSVLGSEFPHFSLEGSGEESVDKIRCDIEREKERYGIKRDLVLGPPHSLSAALGIFKEVMS